MATFKKPTQKNWSGRISGQQLYMHEKITCSAIEKVTPNSIALLGYACDEGVKRNQGRIGAIAGPDAIRAQLGKMPNHLAPERKTFDCGTIECKDGDIEAAHNSLSLKVSQLLKQKAIPIVLGGGHDMAYGHYKGLLAHVGKGKTIGIVNFDAHFDLRNCEDGPNSGTPFYQIAQDCQDEDMPFEYLCLGIRPDSNDRILFEKAIDLNVDFLRNSQFSFHNLKTVTKTIDKFISKVDYIYTTIDLDGFSSAYAPGVSAASPMGFSPDIVMHCLSILIRSKKLLSLDIAEMNPTYDIDHQTAKLAASLVHLVMRKL
ncbi:formimidoylglutamase [Maribacter polysaccharolyticus]|uniref:formimidoylglutamase n=1 Tax=Maribacter polysaccharolyticus TaxID=3020831 RepID=UPI00237F3B1F|nr:formimidoylglutamase [Maribacter polysaccharolyticus]MDE3742625.1 formimidoylglutamase [Maribacter polysaccharolyticus]